MCSSAIPLDDAVAIDDGGYMCPACHAAWKAEFDVCQHQWEPHRDRYGDPGQYCRKCFGFVADDLFAEIVGSPP
jgi:hypothetical protein